MSDPGRHRPLHSSIRPFEVLVEGKHEPSRQRFLAKLDAYFEHDPAAASGLFTAVDEFDAVMRAVQFDPGPDLPGWHRERWISELAVGVTRRLDNALFAARGVGIGADDIDIEALGRSCARLPSVRSCLRLSGTVLGTLDLYLNELDGWTLYPTQFLSFADEPETPWEELIPLSEVPRGKVAYSPDVAARAERVAAERIAMRLRRRLRDGAATLPEGWG